MSYPISLHTMIERLDSLPPIPQIAQKILSLKISTDEGERELFTLIEKDPALMSKIIGLSNSPIYGSSRKVLTLHDAKALIGSKRVKMIALGFAMMSSVTRKTKGLLNIEGIWKHSLAVAIAMEILVKYMPKERRPAEEEIYLAGLLHDIGFLVLNFLDPQVSDQFCARIVAEPGRPVAEIEAEMLEMNHCELGAEIGRHWGLPESIITVLRYHHTPAADLDFENKSIISIFGLAEKLLSAADINETSIMDISAEDWDSLGIDPLLSNEIKAKITTQTNQAAEINV